MAKGGCDFRELEDFQKKLESLADNMSEILDICAKDLAKRLIAKVIKRTPVGIYSEKSGKKGGTLKKGWSAGGRYKIYHSASTCMIEIQNPVEYASYVEFGHRTRGGGGWVPGKFMMTISAEEVQRDSEAIIAKKLKQLMEAQLK